MGAADTAIPHSMPPFGKQEWGIGYREEEAGYFTTIFLPPLM